MHLRLGREPHHASAVVVPRDEDGVVGSGADEVLLPGLVVLANHVAAGRDSAGEVRVLDGDPRIDERDPYPVAPVSRRQPIEPHGPRAPGVERALREFRICRGDPLTDHGGGLGEGQAGPVHPRRPAPTSRPDKQRPGVGYGAGGHGEFRAAVSVGHSGGREGGAEEAHRRVLHRPARVVMHLDDDALQFSDRCHRRVAELERRREAAGERTVKVHMQGRQGGQRSGTLRSRLDHRDVRVAARRAAPAYLAQHPYGRVLAQLRGERVRVGRWGDRHEVAFRSGLRRCPPLPTCGRARVPACASGRLSRLVPIAARAVQPTPPCRSGPLP